MSENLRAYQVLGFNHKLVLWKLTESQIGESTFDRIYNSLNKNFTEFTIRQITMRQIVEWHFWSNSWFEAGLGPEGFIWVG